MCLEWLSEQKAVVSPYKINLLVSNSRDGYIYYEKRTGSLNIIQVNLVINPGREGSIKTETADDRPTPQFLYDFYLVWNRYQPTVEVRSTALSAVPAPTSNSDGLCFMYVFP